MIHNARAEMQPFLGGSQIREKLSGGKIPRLSSRFFAYAQNDIREMRIVETPRWGVSFRHTAISGGRMER
jgi:hypothetical protein